MTGYEAELRWLYELGGAGMKFGLERMRAAYQRFGSPAKGFRVVHVAGTNGKGSSCAMIERGLRAAGYRTALFTSPHLHQFVERVRIDGNPLDTAEAAETLARFRKADLPLSFFEYAALLGFCAARNHEVDYLVLEVGLGGRLDATNVIAKSELSVITQIALDHTSILGETTAEIAREKAGIFREGGRALIGSTEAADVLREEAEKKSMNVFEFGRDFGFSGDASGSRCEVRVGDDVVFAGALSLRGMHQRQNAAIAAASLTQLLPVEQHEHAILTALTDTSWPGRLEHFDHSGAHVILDGAHNPSGAKALAAHVAENSKEAVLLFGALEGKDHEAMLARFDALAVERVYALPAMRRAGDVHDFPKVRSGIAAASVSEGFELAVDKARERGVPLVVFGSLFVVSEVRALLLGLKPGVETDPVIAL